MSDLTTARQETQNAITQLASDLATAEAFVLTKRAELADALKKVTDISIQHAAAAAMFEAGKIVNTVEGAVEHAAPKIEQEIAAIVASPWAKRIDTYGPWVVAAVVVAYGFGHFAFGWPL
jgi:hypothetical protein